jgi:hypothetical protein
MTATLHEDRYISLLLRMRNLSDESCRENQNTHFTFNNSIFFFFALYEITAKNIVELGRPKITTRRMRIVCWITKATNTPSEYVIIIDFPRQQWLCEHAQYYVIRTLPVLLLFTESLLTVHYFTNYKISTFYIPKFWAVQKIGQSANKCKQKPRKKGEVSSFRLPPPPLGRQKT